MTNNASQAAGQAAVWEDPPYRFEVRFGLTSAEQRQLQPELINLVHENFINHPDYDAEYSSEFMQSDIYMRVLGHGHLDGIFTADLWHINGHPVLHLILAMVASHDRSGGKLMTDSMGLTLDLAAQAFGTDHFYVGLRSANPRVAAELWRNPWVRFYPRLDDWAGDPALAKLRQQFSAQAFPGHRCDDGCSIYHDIYPTSPWEGEIPWHHDERVNDFWREHLRPQGLDAFLFMGPTAPPFEDMPRGRIAYPAR